MVRRTVKYTGEPHGSPVYYLHGILLERETACQADP
jgi:hypothetical protein